MAKNQKSDTPEFKQQIVDLYNTRGYSYPQLERENGVNRSTISGWVKQLSPVNISEDETVTLKEYNVSRYFIFASWYQPYCNEQFFKYNDKQVIGWYLK